VLQIAAAAAVYALAYAARAVRLNFLLPPPDRLGFGRAWSLSGATTFLLQVIPFRGGEVASLALYRRELGMSWSRSTALFALVKLLDSAAILLVGLAGAGVLAQRRGSAVLGSAAAAGVAAGALALLVLPLLGGKVLSWLAAKMPAPSRRRTVALEAAEGLRIAHEKPAAYLLALGGSVGFLAGHLAMFWLVMQGLGVNATLAGLAFASLSSVLLTQVVPSPAGTFGPMETGFAAALVLDGISPGTGAAAAAAAHVLATAVAGLLGLPLLRKPRTGP
jgi:uncharacterized membrane protein YbhN (UPF0104 family)